MVINYLKHCVSPKDFSAIEDVLREWDILLSTAILSTQEDVKYQRFLRATQDHIWQLFCFDMILYVQCSSP